MRLLPETRAQRQERLDTRIADTHLAIAQDIGVAGNLARLYDRLHAVAVHTDVFTTSGGVHYEGRLRAKRAMYAGGVKFIGILAGGEEVAVDLRRATTTHSDPGLATYTELSIFLTSAASRVRAQISTWYDPHMSHHRSDDLWKCEGSMGLSSDGSYMSRREPRLVQMDAVGKLAGMLRCWR